MRRVVTVDRAVDDVADARRPRRGGQGRRRRSGRGARHRDAVSSRSWRRPRSRAWTRAAASVRKPASPSPRRRRARPRAGRGAARAGAPGPARPPARRPRRRPRRTYGARRRRRGPRRRCRGRAPAARRRRGRWVWRGGHRHRTLRRRRRIGTSSLACRHLGRASFFRRRASGDRKWDGHGCRRVRDEPSGGLAELRERFLPEGPPRRPDRDEARDAGADVDESRFVAGLLLNEAREVADESSHVPRALAGVGEAPCRALRVRRRGRFLAPLERVINHVKRREAGLEPFDGRPLVGEQTRGDVVQERLQRALCELRVRAVRSDPRADRLDARSFRCECGYCLAE